VQATTKILQEMNAAVTEEIYPLMGHTISQNEIDKANDLIFNKAIPQI
jgi:phospholipase/carboxylesterase